MIGYWKDKWPVFILRLLLFAFACLFMFIMGENLPYHDGLYYPYFASAVLAAACFGIGRRIGWIQLILGLALLIPVISCPNF